MILRIFLWIICFFTCKYLTASEAATAEAAPETSVVEETIKTKSEPVKPDKESNS